MEYGIVIPDVYLSGLKKEELENVISNTNENIQSNKEHILTHMAAYPRDFKDEFNNDWTWENHIQQELNTVWEELQHDIVLSHLAYLALDSGDKLLEV